MTGPGRIVIVLALLVGVFFAPASQAQLVPVINAGFEDTSGQSVFNEFTFGTPVGWTLHDPNGIVAQPAIFVGTLLPNGTVFFNGPAPEGERVMILFGQGQRDQGEYGFVQTVGAMLSAHTRYDLMVEVGNIASGTADDGTFFDLSGFPGYRVDLLAGGVVIAQDDNGLAATIPEGEFATSLVSITIGETHAQLGEPLAIRLVNLNVTPPGSDPMDPPDLEVDFDDVQLLATPAAIFADGFE